MIYIVHPIHRVIFFHQNLVHLGVNMVYLINRMVWIIHTHTWQPYRAALKLKLHLPTVLAAAAGIPAGVPASQVPRLSSSHHPILIIIFSFPLGWNLGWGLSIFTGCGRNMCVY